MMNVQMLHTLQERYSLSVKRITHIYVYILLQEDTQYTQKKCTALRILYS